MPPSFRHPLSWWDDRLEGKEKLNDGYKAICPAHDDDGPSLHVTDKGGPGKPPVVHCFAGCAYTDVERAAREGSTDTSAPRLPKRNGASRDEKLPKGTMKGWDWLEGYTGVPQTFLRTLDLEVKGDRVLFTFPHNGIAKWRVATSEKKAMGWNKPGAFTPYLWPMPGDELPDKVYLTEGESDCIILRYLGFNAYAITHGAKATLPPAVYRILKERGVTHVVLAFDQDETGEQAIETYTEAAIDAGMTVSTLRPRLHILEGETDIRDWHLRTGGKEPLEDETQEVAITLEDLASTMPVEVPWLRRGYFAREAVTLVAGPPKAGKSSLVAKFLAALERGEAFLGVPGHKGCSILMTEEFGATIIEKASTFGVTEMRVLTQHQAARAGWSFGDALSRIVSQAQRSGCAAVVIDTLSAWAQFKDENDASEVTRAMTLIRNTAAGSGLSVIVIHHTKKGGGEYGEAVRGSGALFAQADILIEYTYKGRDAREVTVTSRFANPPDPIMVRMRDGDLEAIDAVEFLAESATEVLEALGEAEDGMTRKQLEEALGKSAGNSQLRQHLDVLEDLKKVAVVLGPRNQKTYRLTENGRSGGGTSKMNVRMVSDKVDRERPSTRRTDRALR